MALQIALEHTRRLGFLILVLTGDTHLFHRHIRHDTGRLDGTSARCVIQRRGQLDGRAVRQTDHGLHRALTETLCTDQHGAMVVLQCTCHDLGSRGRTVIDQHDQRHTVQLIAGLRLEGKVASGARLGADNPAPVEEQVGHRDSLVEQAARVVAQIKHCTIQMPTGLFFQRIDIRLEQLASAFLELGDAQIGIARSHEIALHGLHLDDVAHDPDLQRLGLTTTHDGQRDLGSRLAAHQLHRLGQRHITGQQIVDLDDDITGLDAGTVSRRILNRGDDTDRTFGCGDLDTQTAELAGGIHLHLFVHLLVEIDRMRIEAAQHAGERTVDQLLITHFLDIGAAHHFHDLGELLQLLVVGSGDRFGPLALQKDHATTGQHNHQKHPDNLAHAHTHNTILFSNSSGIAQRCHRIPSSLRQHDARREPVP